MNGRRAKRGAPGLAAAALGLSCSGASAPAPAAALLVQIGPGPYPAAASAACNLAAQVPPYSGDPYSPSPWANGQTDGDATVSVQCMVHLADGSYSVEGELSDGKGTSLSLSGTVGSGSGTVRATFMNQGVTFNTASPCMVNFALDEEMAVKPGAVWALAQCPEVSDGQGHTCYANIEFVFQDCSE